MQLPLSITRSGAERVTQSGLTKNISSGGVLFTAQQQPDIGASIEYVISLGQVDPPVSLRCIGKVVRSNRSDGRQTAYEVAATLERYEFIRAGE